MATGRENQVTKQAGEYLVAAQLCRRDLIATTFTGNVPEIDIIAMNERLETTAIQVKTSKGNVWHFKADDFLDMTISGGKQEINGKKRLTRPELIMVFVRLNSDGLDEFYICQKKDIQDIVHQRYSEFLRRKGGVRPRQPASTHCGVYSANLAPFKENWKLITGSR